MIKPFKQDRALLQEIAGSRTQEGFRLWWLGQSGFLVQFEGRHLLLDPYLSDSLTTKYASTDKPHTRMTERVVDPAKLDFIDVATSTHNHTDHLDADTLLPLIAANPEMKLIIPEANRAFVAGRLKCDTGWPIGLDDARSVEAGGFEVHGVPAAHEELSVDERGQHHFMGFVVKFGPWTLYHSGDTVLYDEMVEKLVPFDIDVALLPINGRRPERRVAGNLWGREAAWLAKEIGARCAVPCHYEMFEFNTEPPDEFLSECRRLAQPCRVLRCGERFVSTEIAG